MASHRRDNARRNAFPSNNPHNLPHDLITTSVFDEGYGPDADGIDIQRILTKRELKSSRRKNKQPAHQQSAAPKGPVMPKPQPLRGQTPTQQGYINSLLHSDKPYVVAHGPAGTGKTYPAVIHAIQQLQAGNIKRIVITRPLVNVEEEEVGTLPGGIIEKVSPWMLPILDLLKEHYSVQQLKQLLESETIEIAPLAFMRGRTFKDVFLIADEMQNATPNQFKMLLTRIGPGSRFVITGDIEQTDRKTDKNGLADLIKRLRTSTMDSFANHEFMQADVVRHEAIDGVLTLYA